MRGGDRDAEYGRGGAAVDDADLRGRGADAGVGAGGRGGAVHTVGEVKRIPHSLRGLTPVLATLGASTAAFFAVVLEGVARGAVEAGLNEITAMEIAAEAMRGAAGLVAGGRRRRG